MCGSLKRSARFREHKLGDGRARSPAMAKQSQAEEILPLILWLAGYNRRYEKRCP